MAKFDLDDKKALKKVAKELQVIINPTDDDTGDPIDVAKGAPKKIIEKIKAVGACLTPKDEISKELAACLKELKVNISDSDESGSSLPTADEIGKMKMKELKALVKENKAWKIKTTGLKAKELQAAIIEKIGSSSDSGAALPDPDDVADMDFDDLEELIEGNDLFSGIDIDDYDEDEDDEVDKLREEILSIIEDASGSGSDDDTGDDTGDALTADSIEEMDFDDLEKLLETNEALSDLDIDDYDEDEDDEVDKLKSDIIALICPAGSDDDTGDATEIPDDADFDALEEICEKYEIPTDDIDPDDFDEDEDDEVDDFRDQVKNWLAENSGGDSDSDESGDDSIEDVIKAAADDFKALKKIMKDSDLFADLASDKKAMKKFKDSPEKLAKKMVKLVQKGGAAGAGKGKKGKAADKGGKDKKPNKNKAEKKPGVIAVIIETIEKKPSSHDQILKALVKAFPDRDEEKMAKTIKIQVPNRIKKEKNSSLKEKDGKWFFAKEENGIKKTPKK